MIEELLDLSTFKKARRWQEAIKNRQTKVPAAAPKVSPSQEENQASYFEDHYVDQQKKKRKETQAYAEKTMKKPLSSFTDNSKKNNAETPSDNQERKDPHLSFFNPSTFWRFIGYDTRQSQRKEQLKQDFQESVKQHFSHHDILSSFAGFKGTVISRLLDIAGVSREERQGLLKDAKAEIFEENIHLMAENIYNQVLSNLIYGNRKSTRPFRLKMKLMQGRLKQQMDKLKDNYWSQERLLEEHKTQARKIQNELIDERHNLQYFIDQLWHGSAGRSIFLNAENIELEESQ